MKKSLLCLCAASALAVAGQADKITSGRFQMRGNLQSESIKQAIPSAKDKTGTSLRALDRPVKIMRHEESSATYNSHINSEEEFEKYSLIDGNNDGNNWKYTDFTGMASIQGNSNKGDDWIVTPAFELREGERYIVTVNIKNGSGRIYPELMEVKLGNAPTAEALTLIAIEPTVIDHDILKEHWAYFTAPYTGTYYLGVHHISEPDMNWIGLSDIRVSAPGEVALPDEIAYETQVLFESDFSDLEGSRNAPVDITDYSQAYEGETYRVTGMEGWGGNGVGAAGDCLVALGSKVGTDKAEIIPPRANCTGLRQVKISLTGEINEFSDRAKELNDFDFFKGLVMYSNSAYPSGWAYSGTEISDIDFAPLKKGSETTLEYDFELPESIYMSTYDENGNYVDLGSQPVDQITMRISGYWGSDVALTNYKVTAMKPLIPKPTALRYSDYTDNGFTLSWDPCEGADSYVVVIYDHEYAQWGGSGPDSNYLLSRSQTFMTEETSIHIDIDTSDAVILEVYAIKGDKRSESSGYLRAFDTEAPVLTDAQFGDLDHKVSLTWQPVERAHSIEVIGRIGEPVESAAGDVEVAKLDFSNVADIEIGTGLYDEVHLDDLCYGWTLAGNWGFSGGAAAANNYATTWGIQPLTIYSSYYNFSKVNGDITVSARAKADEASRITAQLYGFVPEQHGYGVIYETEAQPITSDFAEYTLSLPSNLKENMQVRVVVYGQSNAYVSDIKVNCTMTDGETFYKPYFTGSLDLIQNPGINSAKLPTAGAGEYQFVISASRMELHTFTDWDGTEQTVKLCDSYSDHSNIIDLSAVITPYAGLDETFADMTFHYDWEIDDSATPHGNGGGYVDLCDNSTYSRPAVNNDNGYIEMRTSGTNSSLFFISGIVSLAEITNPELTFYIFDIKDSTDPNINEFYVYAKDMETPDSEWKQILGRPIHELCAESKNQNEGWCKVSASLADYTGKCVKVAFEPVCKLYGQTWIDNIQIASRNEGSDVADIDNDDVTIIGGDGSISILNAEGTDLNIAGIDGTIHFSGIAEMGMTIDIEPGIYIVKAGKTTKKVTVK